MNYKIIAFFSLEQTDVAETMGVTYSWENEGLGVRPAFSPLSFTLYVTLDSSLMSLVLLAHVQD